MRERDDEDAGWRGTASAAGREAVVWCVLVAAVLAPLMGSVRPHAWWSEGLARNAYAQARRDAAAKVGEWERGGALAVRPSDGKRELVLTVPRSEWLHFPGACQSAAVRLLTGDAPSARGCRSCVVQDEQGALLLRSEP